MLDLTIGPMATAQGFEREEGGCGLNRRSKS
jgi:hypothetical protein